MEDRSEAPLGDIRASSLASGLLMCATSALVLVTTAPEARGQQSQGTPLPTVPVSPPAQAQPQPKAAPAPKVQQAAPAPQPKAAPKAKSAPKATPAPKAQASVAPPSPPESVAPPALANALGTYNPALDLPRLPLPPGTVLTTAGPVDGYRALTSMSATKTATPIEQTPQSIQVLPKVLLQDQTTVSVDEGLRNVSGVQGTNALQTPAYDSTKVRGFPAEQWSDGLTVYYNAGDRDSLVNVERIEVLKGPSAILYGGGTGAPLGGVVNMVSKLPTDRAVQEAGVMIGSHKYVQPYFDINQPLNPVGTALFRMTGQFTSAQSFIDVVDTRRYSLHPTLTLTNKTDTTLTVQADFTSWRQQEYQGLPAMGTVAGDFRIRRDLFIGDASIPDSYSRRQALTATLDHRFNTIWSASLKVRYSQSEFDERVLTLFGADSFQANKPLDQATIDFLNFINGTNFPSSTWGLANAHLYQKLTEHTVAANLKAEFVAGFSKNTFLIGADYSRVKDKGILDAEFQLAPGLADLTNPDFGKYAEPGIAGRFNDSRNTYVTQGAFAQLQSTLWGRVHLLGSFRLASISIENMDVATFNFDTSETVKVLPRLGAVVDVLPGLSVFASYSEGMKANPFVDYKDTPIPEMSQQAEAGLKLNLPGGLTGTLAVFDIKRQNVPVADPSTPGLSVAEGEQRSRGFEADLLWQPNRHWQFLASYAHIDAELTKAIATTGTPAGNGLIGVPADSGRLWANYKLDGALQGWSVGAGVYVASRQFVDLANEFSTPGYHSIDAKIAYDTKRFSASLSVKNLTGEQYFVPYSYFGGRVAPVDGPQVYGRIVVRNE